MPRNSVFLEALGPDAARLRPEVYEYVAGPAATPQSTGAYGVGEGVFEIAGARFGRLMALFRPFVGRDLLMTRIDRNVPFTIVNTPAVGADGRMRLEALRTFHFSDGPQQFRDVLEAGDSPGTLINYLGASRRLCLVLTCVASPQGNLVISSRSTHVRVGGTRMRLPRLLGVSAHVEDGYDSKRHRRTIDVVIKNPIVGVVMQYRGWFQYRYVDGRS